MKKTEDLVDQVIVEEEIEEEANTGPIIEIGAGQEQHTGTDAPIETGQQEESEKVAAGRGPSF
jgi:hypothetical protein